MKVIGKLSQLLYIITQRRRERYYYKLISKLKNKAPSIIANDCMGGFIYHNLGLKFYTPTINLAIPKDSFFLFLENLQEYLKCELIEIKDESKPYPVGVLKYNNKDVEIWFIHYKNFTEAKEKWEERKERIDFSNLFIIQTIAGTATEEDIRRFDNLPYRFKVLITANNIYKSKNVVVNKVFKKKGYRKGQILEYKSDYSCKRYMDDWNYVKFLNQNCQEK